MKALQTIGRPAHGESGMTLAEVMVALFLVALLFIVALSMLEIDKRIYLREDALLEASAEASHAIEIMERDLLMTGYQVDVRTIADPGGDGTTNTADDIVGQAKIVYAGPWEIALNADVEDAVEAIEDGTANDALPNGYAPVTFFTGAETIVFTLDSNGDGSINSSDRGDEAEEHASHNDSLYALHRVIYGSDGSANNTTGGTVALIRGPDAYPSSVLPTPLFRYWGYFDTDPALDLWGDTGAGGGTAGNGVLEAGELSALGPVTGEDADDDGVLDTGEDRDGNGSLERRVSDLIKEVDVYVIGETLQPDLRWEHPTLSSSTHPYRYRVTTASTRVRPRNVDLPGGACGDEPEPTTSVSVANACADALADGKVSLGWSLSNDDGANETDIERYLVYRTDVNSVFGPTPFSEVVSGTSSYQDDWIDARSWPPRQYWYKLRAMDCTPALSVGDPVAGPYPADVGPMFPLGMEVRDVPGDDGTQIDLRWNQSHDDPTNTTGYGADVSTYHVYRANISDYRCVAPVNKSGITATGSSTYLWTDNATNSASAVSLGELYYYWLRAVDSNGDISPYGQRACARPYEGPVMPEGVAARVASYATTDHPAEIWFAPPEENEPAGYDPYQIEYRIYKSRDLNGDSILDSLVDDALGYRTTDYVDSVTFKGMAWAVGTGSACSFHTIDGATTWRNVDIASTSALRAVAFNDRLAGVAVGDLGTIVTTDDGGASATTPSAPSSANLAGIAWLSDSRAVAVGSTGTMFVSDDAGSSWSSVTLSTANDLTGIAATGNLAAAVGLGGTVQVSTDRGGTWAAAASSPSDDLFSACAYSASGSQTIIAGGQDQTWASSDAGTSWSATALPGGITGDVIALSCLDPGMVLAIADDGSSTQVLLSSDGGASWSIESLSTTGRATGAALVDDTLAYVVDDAGYAYFRQADTSWVGGIVDIACPFLGLAVQPLAAWEDSSTKTGSTGERYYYVVTAKYAVGDATLDGESGMIADRSSAFESPDDTYDQVLVDSCRNIEASAVQP